MPSVHMLPAPFHRPEQGVPQAMRGAPCAMRHSFTPRDGAPSRVELTLHFRYGNP
ncbi:hypothetical protein [Komagataeibacter kakiaceti]